MNAAETGQGQRLAEGLFHDMELVTGIGRGAVVDAGGIGEAVSGCHVNEDPQRFQLHNDDGLRKNRRSVKRYLARGGRWAVGWLAFACLAWFAVASG
jgi:hypothetical protein